MRAVQAFWIVLRRVYTLEASTMLVHSAVANDDALPVWHWLAVKENFLSGAAPKGSSMHTFILSGNTFNLNTLPIC